MSLWWIKLTRSPVAIRVQIPNTTFKATSLYSSTERIIIPSSYWPAREVPAKLASSPLVVVVGYSVGTVYHTIAAG